MQRHTNCGSSMTNGNLLGIDTYQLRAQTNKGKISNGNGRLCIQARTNYKHKRASIVLWSVTGTRPTLRGYAPPASTTNKPIISNSNGLPHSSDTNQLGQMHKSSDIISDRRTFTWHRYAQTSGTNRRAQAHRQRRVGDRLKADTHTLRAQNH